MPGFGDTAEPIRVLTLTERQGLRLSGHLWVDAQIYLADQIGAEIQKSCTADMYHYLLSTASLRKLGAAPSLRCTRGWRVNQAHPTVQFKLSLPFSPTATAISLMHITIWAWCFFLRWGRWNLTKFQWFWFLLPSHKYLCKSLFWKCVTCIYIILNMFIYIKYVKHKYYIFNCKS